MRLRRSIAVAATLVAAELVVAGVATAGVVRSNPRAQAAALDAVGTALVGPATDAHATVIDPPGAAVLKTRPTSTSPNSPMLTTDDFGPGWESTPAQAAAETGTCFRPRAALYDSDPLSHQAATWVTTGEGVPTASEIVATYQSASRAESAFEDVIASVSGCYQFSTGGAGEQAVATVAPASLPAVGQRSVAYQVVVRLGESVGTADFVLAQQNSRLMLFVYGDSGTPAESTVAALDATAATRLAG